MKLHELKPKRAVRLQRIGRSGKRGSYSGRGQKGQRSRSGHRIRPAERDILLKIPKMRGFRNKPKDVAPAVINLNTLAKKFAKSSGAVIDRASLREVGLIKKDYKGKIKVLGSGEISFPATFSGLELSTAAKAKVAKAGGMVK